MREAILELFDFEWINHNYFFDLYARTASYFDGSANSRRMASRPMRARRELLAPFPGAVRADIMQGTWPPPVTDGSGRDRATLAPRASTCSRRPATRSTARNCVHRATGKPFTFEILVTTREQERLALVFVRDLKRAGIDAQVRSIDAAQFERRRINFDFDMMEYRWEQSLSPGNEQVFYWGSAAADQPGTRNYMGVKSKAVDAMIAMMLKATERDDFVAATRALDRVLMSGFYVVPLYFPPKQWVARWTRIEHPLKTSLFGYLPETWWRPNRDRPDNDPARRQGQTRRPARPAPAAPRSTICSAAPACNPPDALALIDPPNRADFTDGAAAAADLRRRPTAPSPRSPRNCAGSACRPTPWSRSSFPTRSRASSPCSAVLRAGMIAAPLPLLWRAHDLKAALSTVGAKAIITTSRVGAVDHADLAMQVAAELFPIRFICAFGDGPARRRRAARRYFRRRTIRPSCRARCAPATPPTMSPSSPSTSRRPKGARRGGAQPCATDGRRLAGVVSKAGAARNANILSAIPPSSFAGLAASLLPWLLEGGTLSLHHGFEPATFFAQCQEHFGGMIVLPGPALGAIGSAVSLSGADTAFVALWRSPEQLATAAELARRMSLWSISPVSARSA